MKRYAASQMDTFYPVTQAVLQMECIVEISSENLLIKYMDEGRLVEYVGVADGEGHYLITGRGFPAEATLHLSGGRCLEGSWKEAQQFGMWRIFLEESE